MRRSTLTLAALAAVGAVLAVLAPGAGAHATLEATVPQRGAVLKGPPSEVRLSFSEPVELSFGSVRVFDSQGEEVQSGDPTHPDGDDSQVAIGLPADLGDGSYTATYRVVSADSHPVSGGFVFAVGEGSSAPAASVSDLLDDPEASAATKTGFAVARAGSYAAIALAVGGAFFWMFVWSGALARVAGTGVQWAKASTSFGARAKNVLVAAVALGLVCTAAGIVFQGALASGKSFFGAADPSVVGDVLETRFGTVWGIRFGIWVALGAVIAAALALRPSRRVIAWTAGPLLVALAATPAFGGHAGSLEPSWALVPSTALHVLSMSTWVGGLAMLVFVLPAATRELEPPDRSRLLAATLHRFSPVALAAVIALLATGILQSLLELDELSALWETTFGRLILAKAALLAVLIAIGGWHRRRSIPQMDALAGGGSPPGAAGVALRRALRGEVALVAGAIVATAFLAAQTPNSQAQGPAAGSTDFGSQARLDYTVDPAEAGSNEIHLYLTDSETGTPYEVPSAKASASQPDRDIGPLDIQLEKTGPGHFTAPAASLSPPGEWTIELRSRVSRFEELRAAFEVDIE